MDCSTLRTVQAVGARLQCVEQCLFIDFRSVFYPHTAYLSLECQCDSSTVRIGVTMQKRRRNKFLFLKDNKILGWESNIHCSSRAKNTAQLMKN